MDLAKFSEANKKRCESPDGFDHLLEKWSTSDWFTALMGEVGEAANVAKKLNRLRDSVKGFEYEEEALKVMLRSEIGDAFIYLDLLTQSLGMSLSDLVPEVFNAKSEELGMSHRFKV